MDSTRSPKVSKLDPESNQDMLSNLPSIATDKILKCLPLSMVAKMSVLSTQWRDKWVSHRYLVFDEAFWRAQGNKGEKVNSIIINILLLHNGPIHQFHLHIPELKGKNINLNQYLSFLSRTHVKKIAIVNWYDSIYLPSHIFLCNDLQKLSLERFALNHLPSCFEGFANLLSLELVDVSLKNDLLASLISRCPRLMVLWLEDCIGITSLAINAPNLKELAFIGAYAPLQLRSVTRLCGITLCLKPTEESQALSDDTLNSIKLLATSSEMYYLHFGGQMCKLLAAAGVPDSHFIAFKHLEKLCLTKLDLGDLSVFSFTLGVIQSCPSINDLEISVTENKDAARHKIDLDYSYKLGHLITIKIAGITGSGAELQFLEYVLSIAVVLEDLYFECGKLDPTSELKVSRGLLRLRRASTKAQLVCLDKLVVDDLPF